MNLNITYTSGDGETFTNLKSISWDKNGDLNLNFIDSLSVLITAENIFDFEVTSPD